MQSRLSMFIAALTVVFASITCAQEIQVNRANKTIEVIVSETVRVDPELAQLRIGYRNFAARHEAAVEQNVQVANKVTKALLDLGVSKDALETETISVNRTRDADDEAGNTKLGEFVASQEWKVSVPITVAENVLELAIRSGANVVREVGWTVREPEKIRESANAAALKKAQVLAEQMAKQMRKNVGELLYVSNVQPGFARIPRGLMSLAMPPAPPPAPPALPIHLFPAKVEETASVTAVFALE